MALYDDGRNDFKEFSESIVNSVITFSMKDGKTGIYKIANKAASIALKTPTSELMRPEYYITYNFTSEDTDTSGIYIGQFKIIFLNQSLQPNGSLIVPIAEELYIHITDSFVKSDITYI